MYSCFQKFFIIGLALAVSACFVSFAAQAEKHDQHKYVTANSLNVRLCADTKCPSTNRLYKGAKVSVFEIKGNWARISEYYDSTSERKQFPSITEQKVARWVWANYTSDFKPSVPSELTASNRYFDKRIKGIPKPGEYGLSAKEVLLMRKYAYGMLKTKLCSGIEYADKSVSKPNTFFVNCSGEVINRFFTASDIKADW